ncbi:MAG TPA: hypothetical protein VE338_12970 [Ktedonobacterales bacterium]|nr:hypothetical protein [Ktedonobacterales bacterium]
MTLAKSTPYNAVHNGDGSDVWRAQLLGALFFFWQLLEAEKAHVLWVATAPHVFNWRDIQNRCGCVSTVILREEWAAASQQCLERYCGAKSGRRL